MWSRNKYRCIFQDPKYDSLNTKFKCNKSVYFMEQLTSQSITNKINSISTKEKVPELQSWVCYFPLSAWVSYTTASTVTCQMTFRMSIVHQRVSKIVTCNLGRFHMLKKKCKNIRSLINRYAHPLWSLSITCGRCIQQSTLCIIWFQRTQCPHNYNIHNWPQEEC